MKLLLVKNNRFAEEICRKRNDGASQNLHCSLFPPFCEQNMLPPKPKKIDAHMFRHFADFYQQFKCTSGLTTADIWQKICQKKPHGSGHVKKRWQRKRQKFRASIPWGGGKSVFKCPVGGGVSSRVIVWRLFGYFRGPVPPSLATGGFVDNFYLDAATKEDSLVRPSSAGQWFVSVAHIGQFFLQDFPPRWFGFRNFDFQDWFCSILGLLYCFHCGSVPPVQDCIFQITAVHTIFTATMGQNRLLTRFLM